MVTLITDVLFEHFLICCVTGQTELTMKRNGCFTFQTIILDVECVDSPINILFAKKVGKLVS